MSDHTVAFIHDLAFSQIPEATLENARRCLLDTIGVAAGAVGTDAGRIVRDHVAAFHCPAEKGARMLFDGRRVAPPGAAMAGAGGALGGGMSGPVPVYVVNQMPGAGATGAGGKGQKRDSASAAGDKLESVHGSGSVLGWKTN